MNLSPKRYRLAAVSILAGIVSLGGVVALTAPASATITGSVVNLTPPVVVPTPVHGGVASQPAAGLTIAMPGGVGGDVAGDQYTFVVNPNGVTGATLTCAGNNIGFGGTPTVTATANNPSESGGTPPTFTTTITRESGNVVPACGGVSNQLSIVVATAGTLPSDGTAWLVNISGITYTVGQSATPGNIDTADSTFQNFTSATASPLVVPSDASVTPLSSDVTVGSNAPPVALLSGSDTNQPISPITLTETAAGAVPLGWVCFALGSGATFTGTPTVTATGGGATATGTVIGTGGTANELAFHVTAISVASPATYSVSAITVNGGSTPGPVGFAVTTGNAAGSCGGTALDTAGLRAFTVLSTTRTAGADADATAIAELESAYPSGPANHTVVLATDANFPDALAASYLAGQLSTGILLTPTAALSTETANAIRIQGITTVDVVGGVQAVSQNVIDTLKATPQYQFGGTTQVTPAKTLQVNVIAGQTEYDTASDIAQFLPNGGSDLSAFPGAYGKYDNVGGASSASGPSTPTATAILATGTGFQDATAASVVGYANHFPVLLTTPNALSAQAQSAFTNLGIHQVILMGGPLAISDAVVNTLTGEGISVLRIAGTDYTDTAQQLAQFEMNSLAPVGTGAEGLGWDPTSKNQMTLARGDFFTDALAGSAYAATAAGTGPQPILLTFDPNTVGSFLGGFLNAAGSSAGVIPGDTHSQIFTVNVLGGVQAITLATLGNVLAAIAAG
ncbi:MAG TPA: cell wall-binding repeat-containing protein [Acidimicrobiales bacterium]|nr:cell wall-binding repeat-containing protein [Acidimicrobiales bacterium]